jgi:serine protease AprX
MWNKIDKTILQRINVQSSRNDNIDVIISGKKYNELFGLLRKQLGKKEIISLPIISSFAVNIDIASIIQLASDDIVEYISNNTKVCGLIYNSKKFLGVDKLISKTNKKINHTAVVIDTGIYPHIDFVLGRNRIIKFIDLVNNRDAPYDDNGHGTFVSGVLCGNSIIDKYSGVDDTCNLIMIKALDNNGETNSIKILQAMQWILDNKHRYNIRVVCMSFGSISSGLLDPLVKGVEVLWNSGIVVVSAGGNSGPESQTIMSPGASRKIITVGSLDKISGDLKVADFSSRGPINNVYKPDMVVPGVDIISTNVFDKEKQYYTKMTGTSVSTPMVAGIVSLLLKINPNYTPDQIKYMLIRACEEIDGDRNSEGFGVLKLDNLRLI